MRLKHIHIDGFGKLSQFDLDLVPGFQVLYGNNEFGKSTVLQFIRAMFYGVADRKNIDPLRSRHRYKPWQGGVWGGSILFSFQNRDYRLTRRFGETKAQDYIQLTYVQSGEELNLPWGGQQQPGEYYFGLTQSAFQAASFLGQMSEDRSVSDQDGSVGQRLQSLAGSLDESVSAQTMLQRFDNAEKDLTRTRGKSGRLAVLREQLELHNENEARYRACEEEADRLLLTWESINDDYQKQVLKRHQLQNEREKVQQLSDAYQALQKRRDEVQALKRFQERSGELEKQLLFLHSSPATVGQDLQTLRLQQNLGREVQQEKLSWQEKKSEWSKNLAATETKIKALNFAKEDDFYPWDIYQQKQTAYAECEAEQKRWLALCQLRDRVKEAETALSALREEEEKLVYTDGQLKMQIEEKQKSVEIISQQVRSETDLAKENEQQVIAEETRLAERRQVRNQDLIRRKAKYKRHLTLLRTLSLLFILFAVLSFVISYVWTDGGLSRQIVLLIGLVFLTLGTGLAVHRSIFPAVEPTLVTEPDAEGWLKQLQEQKAKQNAILDDRLQEQKAAEEDLQNLRVDAAQLQVRREEIHKQIERAKSAVESQENQLTEFEGGLQQVPTTDELENLLSQGEKELAELLAWRKAFLQKRELEDDQELLHWKASCLAEEQHLTLLQKQGNDLVKQQVVYEERQRLVLQDWKEKYSYLLDLPEFFVSKQGGKEMDGEEIPWDWWLEALQLYEQKLVQTMEGYRHTSALYKQMMNEQGGKTWLQLEQERSQDYAQYLLQLQSLPTIYLLWDSYEDKKDFFREQQVSYSRKLEEAYLAEADLKENMQEISGQRRQILQDLPLESERHVEKQRLQTAIGEQEKYLETLRQGRSWLQQAADDLANTIAPALNEKAGAYLYDLTKGAHQEVFVARDMSMHLGTTESSELQREILFSAGAQEQIYLALRLSLADVLTMEEGKSASAPLPLFCDDPFVNYDQERMISAYQLLAKLGREGRQILLTTCHPLPEGLSVEEEQVRWIHVRD